MANLVPVIEQLKVLFAELKLKVADNGGWDWGDSRDVYEAFLGIVMAIEQIASEMGGLTESEKKSVLSDTLNWLVDIPAIPETIEGMAFDLIVNLVWEAAKDRLAKRAPTPPVV